MSSDPTIIAWIEGEPGPFEASSRMRIWRMAYADYCGKDTGGFDLGWMFSVNKLGFIERDTSSGDFFLEISPKTP